VPTVVIDPKNKTYGNFHPTDLLTTAKKSDLLEIPGLVDATSLKDGDKAFIVGPHCNGTNVFTVERTVKLPDGSTEYHVWGDLDPSSSSAYKSWRNPQAPQGEDMGTNTIVLSNKKGKQPVQVGKTLFLPDSFKAFVLKEKPKKESKGGAVPCSPEDGKSSLNVGTMNDLILNLSKSAEYGVHQLRLITDGLGFCAEVDRKQGPMMSKLGMLKNLIINHGMGKDDAELLLKEAMPRKPKTYFVKYAADSQPNSGWFPEPLMGAEYGISVPTQYPQTMAQNLGPSDSLSNREFYRDDRMLDMPTKRMTEQAAEQGQKEVLDTAVISGLVKTMEPDSKVDSYVGDLLLGLDRIGRILFMYYQHNDRFRERYGQQDMADMEDSLRTCFKSLGELVLFIKQKTVEVDGGNSPEADLTSVIGTQG
jgi:hypothetical protein